MESIIELDNLSVHFGRLQALKELSGSYSARSIGLLGPNGAGKTTLIHTLLGFHKPSSGTARVFGNDIRHQDKEARELIGYMPERDSFIAGMSAVRFVRLMAELSGIPPRQALERAHEALFYVGLGESRYRNIETYSQGMKQRAKLAQALVHGPRLIFLDEPTNGLDPPARERMIELVKEIRDTGEVHVVLSSHLLGDVEQCCEEVLILKGGQIAYHCNLEAERKANRKFLELEAHGDKTEEYVEAIRGLGVEVAPSRKRRLKMVLPPQIQIQQLYHLAAERRVEIRHLDYKKDSLQDIFLKAMDENREQPLAPPKQVAAS